jgi:tRNA1Val (adenine37-N6)-methyltransferase
MAEWEEKETGRWEPLGSRAKVYVTKKHHFTTDTILLADFAAPGKKDICADFGTGCGTIPLLWAARNQPACVYGVELQEEAFAQASRSVAACGFDIHLIQGDIRRYRELFPQQNLDLISCNPPYKAQGAGLKNPDQGKLVARHEEEMTLADLAEAARFCLKFGGSLCICLRPERLAEAVALFQAYDLEPKVLRLVQARKEKPPSLFLLRCRRGGNPGLTVLPTLFLEENGSVSREMMEIYGDYKENGQ